MLQLDGTFLFVLLSFLIFIFLMNLICYKPIMKVISEREKFYEKNKDTVLKTGEKKEAAEKKIEEEISKAKFESFEILKNSAEENKKKIADAINFKQRENSSEIKKIENSLEENSNAVKEELKAEIESYVKNLASKILKRSASDIHVDRKKVDEILK